MNIIPSIKLNYNIGIDGGDSITTILIDKNTIIPCDNKMTMSIPDNMEEYNIKILIGPNILSIDNVLLDDIKIINNRQNEKVLFLYIKINISYIFIIIETKLRNIYKNIINYRNINDSLIKYIDVDIDIPYYKITFELNNLIKNIRNKIKLNYINIDDETKILLEDKFNNITIKLNEKQLTYQKILDIRNNLKNTFFIE